MNNDIVEQARYNVHVKCWDHIFSLFRSSALKNMNLHTYSYIQRNMLEYGLHNIKNNVANYQVLKKEL